MQGFQTLAVDKNVDQFYHQRHMLITFKLSKEIFRFCKLDYDFYSNILPIDQWNSTGEP